LTSFTHKKTRFSALLFLSTACLFLSSSLIADESKNELAARLDKIKQEITPDARLDLFEISLDENATPNRAEIITTSPEAAEEVKKIADDFPGWKLDVKLYPEENEELEGRWRAIVVFSTIQLQKEPDFASEWGTQTLMGTPVRVIKKAPDGWLLIQNFDGYFGYTPAGNVVRKTREEYNAQLASKRLVYLPSFGFVYSAPDADSQTISDLVAGCVLEWKNEETSGDFYRVETPDGRTGWVLKRETQEWNEWLATRELNAENLIATARRLLGAPYVWGGTSPKGVDCSGLVSLSFRLNGYNILRDVSQIRREGIDVDISQGWRNFQPGDLLIFGKKRANGSTHWRHTAIYIGEGRFIQSATGVRESSLDPNSPDYDAHNARELIKVVRMIGADHTKYFRPIAENPCYQPQ